MARGAHPVPGGGSDAVIHPQARTTPAVRQKIARSTEPGSVLAQHFA
jgi:hypothetical protein